jgi:hypothetical protein
MALREVNGLVHTAAAASHADARLVYARLRREKGVCAIDVAGPFVCDGLLRILRRH